MTDLTGGESDGMSTGDSAVVVVPLAS